jgi:hypothetical protein
MSKESTPKPKLVQWSKKKIQMLMSYLSRFGWGRWETIKTQSHLKFPESEIQSVSRIILRWLLEASEENFEIFKQIVYDADDSKFEKKFTKEFEEAKSIVTANSSKKLQILEMLFYLNKIIETTEVIPDDIFVPILTCSKPVDWWTISDDRILHYGIYQFRFFNYQLIKFSVDLPVYS